MRLSERILPRGIGQRLDWYLRRRWTDTKIQATEGAIMGGCLLAAIMAVLIIAAKLG